MNWLTLDLVQKILTIVGAIVVGLGWKDQETVNMVLGVLMTVIGALWNVFDRNKVEGEVKGLRKELKSLKGLS